MYSTPTKRMLFFRTLLFALEMAKLYQPQLERGRDKRAGYSHQEFYLKSQRQMKELFADLPHAILSTQEIVNKIETYDIDRDVELPAFTIPTDFNISKLGLTQTEQENEYLRSFNLQGG